MVADRLRAVKPGETAPSKQSKAPKLTVAQAAASGNQLATLIATRDRIAVAITSPQCSPRDLAALTKRLDDIIEKIKSLRVQASEASAESGDVDDTFDASAI